MENSAISWTHHTFNPWRGCQHATDEHGNEHPGCAHCYAEAMAKRNPKTLGQWGPEGTRVKAADAYWKLPLKWNREAEKAGERRRVFCASLADVFEDWQGPITDHTTDWLTYWPQDGTYAYQPCWPDNFPGIRWATMDDLRRSLFALIDQTPCLDWLLLTKRPENVRRMWDYSRKVKGHVSQNEGDGIDAYRQNVWLGTSVSDQPTADKWARELMKLRDLVPVLFGSAEPLLEELSIERWLGHYEGPHSGEEAAELGYGPDDPWRQWVPGVDWVIVGGESGPHHRPCDPAWIESIVRQCREAGVKCFVKQDAGARPGMQGRLSDEICGVKEFPRVGE